VFPDTRATKPRFGFAACVLRASQPLLVSHCMPHLAPVVAMMRLRSGKFRSIVFAHGLEV